MTKTTDNDQLEAIKAILDKVPADTPFFLKVLCEAAHMHAAGYQVYEQTLEKDGLPGRAVIFAPVMVEGEGGEVGHIDSMFEIRMHPLVSIQETAWSCNVGYRTIQRWRDEGKIHPIMKNGKQLYPLGLVQDYARKKGHI